MKKLYFILLILPALACSSMSNEITRARLSPITKQSARIDAPSPTATADTCKVSTGIDGGKVNLRECEGAFCGAVLDILTEGESLTIITAGLYVNVTTENGVTGWLNKKYCKGK